MSKKVKTLIFGGAAVVVLVAVLVVLMILPKPGSQETTSSVPIDSGLIALIEEDLNSFSSVRVKNEVDEYTVESLGEKKWGIKAFGDLPQDDVYLDMATALSTFYANSVVAENPDDLSAFGLDKPTLTLEIKFSNDKSYTVKVGDINESSATAYTMIDGKNEVYQVAPSKYTQFMGKSLEFVNHTILPALEADAQGTTVMPTIDNFEIARKDMEKPISFVAFDASKKSENYMPLAPISMVSPIASEANDKAMEKYMTCYFGMSAKQIAAINPTEVQLGEYGFADPTATVNMNYNETSKFTLTIGNAVEVDGEKCHYVMSDKQPIVYAVADSSLPCLSNQPKDFISGIVVIAPVLDIKGVTVNVEGKEYKVNYIKGEDATDAKALTATLNGKDVDVQNAKKYIQVLYDTSVQDINTQAPTGAPVLTISYEYLDGKVDKVEVYSNADRSTIISLNGNNAFVGRAGFVEKIKKETENLINGTEIITDW